MTGITLGVWFPGVNQHSLSSPSLLPQRVAGAGGEKKNTGRTLPDKQKLVFWLMEEFCQSEFSLGNV